jgi:hypothetical protein
MIEKVTCTRCCVGEASTRDDRRHAQRDIESREEHGGK